MRPPWNCEVHLISAPLDTSQLECYDPASRRIDGPRLAASLHPMIRDEDGLLQTIVLTTRPMPPDAMSSSGVLHMNDRLYGASPATIRLLGELTPAAISEEGRGVRKQLAECVADDTQPDTVAIRKIAEAIAGKKPVVFKPGS